MAMWHSTEWIYHNLLTHLGSNTKRWLEYGNCHQAGLPQAQPCPISKATMCYLTLFNSPNTNCSEPLYYVPNTICITEYTREDTRDRLPALRNKENRYTISVMLSAIKKTGTKWMTGVHWIPQAPREVKSTTWGSQQDETQSAGNISTTCGTQRMPNTCCLHYCLGQTSNTKESGSSLSPPPAIVSINLMHLQGIECSTQNSDLGCF